MKVVVALDSFKGSLTSFEAGEAVRLGIRRVDDASEVTVVGIADGGEGTVDALIQRNKGKKHTVTVSDPLGREIKAAYGITDDNTAVMEMSAAAGLTLLEDSERDPMKTTTYGVGQMIADAIEKGCRRFIMGIGGSATNDGGAGMLQALGFGLLDKNGDDIPFGAGGLGVLERITFDGVMPQLCECEFLVACDVKNVLCGKNGCSAVYGPQKGADKKAVLDMDRWLMRYAELVKQYLPNSDKDADGAGAAGGLGFALMTFLKGRLVSGAELVLNEIGFEDIIKDADIVFTGEGRLDGQSVMGKTPIGVAAVSKRYGKPVVAVAGSIWKDAGLCNSFGIDAFFSIIQGCCSLDEAMKKENAISNLADTAEQIFRLYTLHK